MTRSGLETECFGVKSAHPVTQPFMFHYRSFRGYMAAVEDAGLKHSGKELKHSEIG